MTIKCKYKFSVSLLIILCFTLPAGTILGSNLVWDKLEAFGELDQYEEIISRRDRYSKHFDLGGTATRAVFGINSLHYKDIDGLWKDIDPEVVPSNKDGFGYENQTNNLKSYFPAVSSSDSRIEVTSDLGSVKLWMDPSISWIDENGKRTVVEKAKNSEARVEGNLVSFAPFTCAACDFYVEVDRLKQNITLNELPEEVIGKSGFLSFYEEVKLPAGWKVYSGGKEVLSGSKIDGSIAVMTPDGVPAFVFPAPEAYEKDDPESFPFKDRFLEAPKEPTAQYGVEFRNSKLYIMVSISLEWLQEEDRKFPVIIDPTITVYPEGVNSTAFIEGVPTFSIFLRHSTYDDPFYGKIYVGSYYSGFDWDIERGYSEFNTTSIPDAVTSIDNVELHIYKSSGNSQNVSFCKMNLQPSFSSPQDIYNELEYPTTYNLVYAGTSTWYISDLGSTADTDLYNLVTSSANYFPVGVRETSETEGMTETIFMGSEDGALKPYLVVDYTGGSTCDPGEWVGNTSTAWNTATNWCDGVVPTSGTNVIIPNAATTSYDPTLSSIAQCNSITIESGGILNGGSGTLNIYGNWVNNGSFGRGTSTILFRGGATQTIGGTASTSFYKLHFNKTGSKVNLNRDINVYDIQDMGYPGVSTIDLQNTGNYKIKFY
ncbi:hypothetical protein JXI42_11185 [bacterium]|nr:hypothetical protein [bacterium]